MKYYIVKEVESGKEIKCETSAGAFEAYDSFGRSGVLVARHIIEDGFHYIDTYRKMRRRITRCGTHYYFDEMVMSERRKENLQ